MDEIEGGNQIEKGDSNLVLLYLYISKKMP